MNREIKRWIPAVLILLILIVLLVVWYFTFPSSAWEERPNYLRMYVDFVLTRPAEAFLQVNTGPGEIISWIYLPLYGLVVIHFILYFVGKRRGQEYTIANKYYLIYLVCLAIFAISFQNTSQYYDWYWNPELDAPGYVDTWTHITSPWLLGALLVPFAFERHLRWERKSYWFIVFAILAIIAVGWEIGETLDVYVAPQTSKYFNYPMDSLKDIIMGAGIGTILSCWIYDRIVMDPIDKAGINK